MIVGYAHQSGEVCYQTRSPWQLASTLGFVLDRQSGQFLGLKSNELSALHEVLQWGRVPGNNPILRFYGQTFEDRALRAWHFRVFARITCR